MWDEKNVPITTVMLNYLIDNSVMYFCVLIKVKMLCNHFKGFLVHVTVPCVCGIHVKLITLPIIQINVENGILNWVSFCFVVRWCFNYRDSFVIWGERNCNFKGQWKELTAGQIKAIEIDKMAHASYLMPVTCYFNPNWINFNDIWTRTLLAVRGSLNCVCYYA